MSDGSGLATLLQLVRRNKQGGVVRAPRTVVRSGGCHRLGEPVDNGMSDVMQRFVTWKDVNLLVAMSAVIQATKARPMPAIVTRCVEAQTGDPYAAH